MATGPVEVDPDIIRSRQYAENIQAWDQSYIKDAKFGSESGQVVSSVSYFPEELRFFQSFLSFLPKTWALFSPPENFYSNTSSIFSFQVLPSLGPLEIILEKMEKLRKKKYRKKEKEKQKQALMQFFEDLRDLEEDHSFIVKSINQFHKG